MRYGDAFNTKTTPQTKPVPGRNQIENSAGGYVFEADDLEKAKRFCILGSEGGSYYAGEQKLTQENCTTILGLSNTDRGVELVDAIVDISVNGKAPKVGPAIFALAICAAAKDNTDTRAAALKALPSVCRTGSHLLEFADGVSGLRGWGRALRRAFAQWYLDKDVDRLAYQLVKYKKRVGYSHRDLLRLAHPKTKDPALRSLFNWVVRGEAEEGGELPAIIGAVNGIVDVSTKNLPAYIAEHGLTREMVPSDQLSRPEIWEALLEKMPMTAMIRNLGNMTKCGLISQGSDAAKLVSERLADETRIKKARIHPVQVLNAMLTYKAGQGFRGRGTWNSVTRVVDALDGAFYLAFGNVKPTGKRLGIFIDASGSMRQMCSGFPLMNARQGAVAMALSTLAAEGDAVVMAFTCNGNIRNLDISPRRRLDDCIGEINQRAEGTDLSMPFTWATQNKAELDAFVIYTDHETWAGRQHVYQALNEYRRKSGIQARAINCAMVANGFRTSDPRDKLSLECVGFDSSVPQVISAFASGFENHVDMGSEAG